MSAIHQGISIASGTLTIFDTSGNVVNKIRINDDANDFSGTNKRIVGKWDLTDSKGRPVSEGTYLVRGVMTDVSSKKKRVSLMVGVR